MASVRIIILLTLLTILMVVSAKLQPTLYEFVSQSKPRYNDFQPPPSLLWPSARVAVG